MPPVRDHLQAIAACAMLVAIAGCGASNSADDASHYDVLTARTVETTQTVGTTSAVGAELRFGNTHEFTSGISVAVSEPRTFTPSQTAYPPAERGAAFEITIGNGAGRPYQLSGLSISASVDGEPVAEIRDSTQGLHGIGDAGNDVPVGRKVIMTVAFAMPVEDSMSLIVSVQPDPSESDTAHYTEFAR